MIRAPICNDIWRSAISHNETFPDAEKCVMCRCDIPHSLDEHTKILSDGGKLVCRKAPAGKVDGPSTPEYWAKRRAQDRQKRDEKKKVKL